MGAFLTGTWTNRPTTLEGRTALRQQNRRRRQRWVRRLRRLYHDQTIPLRTVATRMQLSVAGLMWWVAKFRLHRTRLGRLRQPRTAQDPVCRYGHRAPRDRGGHCLDCHRLRSGQRRKAQRGEVEPLAPTQIRREPAYRTITLCGGI